MVFFGKPASIFPNHALGGLCRANEPLVVKSASRLLAARFNFVSKHDDFCSAISVLRALRPQGPIRG
jgi:hypothetical protein